jgi:hypothetical protein
MLDLDTDSDAKYTEISTDDLQVGSVPNGGLLTYLSKIALREQSIEETIHWMVRGRKN